MSMPPKGPKSTPPCQSETNMCFTCRMAIPRRAHQHAGNSPPRAHGHEESVRIQRRWPGDTIMAGAESLGCDAAEKRKRADWGSTDDSRSDAGRPNREHADAVDGCAGL